MKGRKDTFDGRVSDGYTAGQKLAAGGNVCE